MASNDTTTQPGTVDDTVAHLSLWGRRPGSGIARVDYASEHAVARCIKLLGQELSAAGIAYHELRLPVDLTPAILARLLIEKLHAIDGGDVISVTGFAEAFSSGDDLEDELVQFNYYRERLAEPPVRQIWWMPFGFVEHFLHAAPDLNSWIEKRLRLDEYAAGQTFWISYSEADRVWAEWIAWQLEHAGYATRLQVWEFRPGTDFVKQMQQAARDADFTISVVSQRYLDSKFAVSEWQAAVSEDGTKGKLIPVRVDDCDLPPLVSGLVYVDLVDCDEDAARIRLLAGIPVDRAKPVEPPSVPGSDSPRFPRVLPRVWNVPFPRNRNFVGRDELLARLRAALLSGKSAALMQAITGMGGVGKTQAAVEYAHRHADDFDVVWWLRCEQPATLANDYAALAEPLDLPEKDSPDQRATIDAVRRWLEGHGRWLLVFDNAADPGLLQEYIPHAASGQILVTSRNPDWEGSAALLHVELFAREESIEYLLQQVGAADRDTPIRQFEEEREAADWLAEQLGDLPLALALAAAYIRNTGLGIKEYLRLFQQHWPALAVSDSQLNSHERTVAGTFRLSIEQARQRSAHVDALLNLCTFLAPEDLPLDLLLDESTGGLPPELLPLFDKENRREATAALCQYSLLERDGDSLLIHRLVQAVTSESLSETSRRRWCEAVIELLNKHLAPNVNTDLSSWPVYARLLSHAMKAREHAERIGVTTPAYSRLLNQLGLYQQNVLAQYNEAEPLMRRALAIFQDSLGPDHPSTQTVARNLERLLTQKDGPE